MTITRDEITEWEYLCSVSEKIGEPSSSHAVQDFVTRATAAIRRLLTEVRDSSDLVNEGRRIERLRCARMVSDLADTTRAANRKKAAAELDMLALDISDYREVQ